MTLKTCRLAILDAFKVVERREGRRKLSVGEIVEEVSRVSDFSAGTISGYVSTRLCINGAHGNGAVYPDLWRVQRGVYIRRRNLRSRGTYTMPALTVRQPWASLIICGIKDVENRTWCPPTGLLDEGGGFLAIHAGKGVSREGIDRVPVS